MQARPGAGGGIESSIAPCNDVSNLHPTRAQKSRARVGTRGPRVPLEGASPGACRSCELSPVGLRWVWTLVMYTFVYVLTVEAKLRLAAAPPAPRGAGGGGWV